MAAASGIISIISSNDKASIEKCRRCDSVSRETKKALNPEITKQTQSLITFEKTDDILQDMRGIID